MDPELDENHNSGNACGSQNAYFWNDMAARAVDFLRNGHFKKYS
jgi:hypothetical protein